MLKIVTFRDSESPILFKPTRKIEVFNKELEKLVREMRETLIKNDGLGLAAPQVNKAISLCIVRMGKEAQPLCNPEITRFSPEQERMEEGCLSFPNVFLEVPRAKSIEVGYQDLKGKPQKLEADGILARTLQHEIDHLNGIAFIEKA